jgi:uncharacterized protein DUF4149
MTPGGPSLVVRLTLLAFWLGAATIFSAVVAPALFDVLPTRTLAGLVVGRVLPVIFYAGIALAALNLFIELRGEHHVGRLVADAVMLLTCAAAQFVVSPRIERVRAAINGPIEQLDAADPRRIEFGRLHGVSVGLLGVAMIAAVVAVIALARTMIAARDARSSSLTSNSLLSTDHA